MKTYPYATRRILLCISKEMFSIGALKNNKEIEREKKGERERERKRERDRYSVSSFAVTGEDVNDIFTAGVGRRPLLLGW